MRLRGVAFVAGGFALGFGATAGACGSTALAGVSLLVAGTLALGGALRLAERRDARLRARGGPRAALRESAAELARRD